MFLSPRRRRTSTGLVCTQALLLPRIPPARGPLPRPGECSTSAIARQRAGECGRLKRVPQPTLGRRGDCKLLPAAGSECVTSAGGVHTLMPSIVLVTCARFNCSIFRDILLRLSPGRRAYPGAQEEQYRQLKKVKSSENGLDLAGEMDVSLFCSTITSVTAHLRTLVLARPESSAAPRPRINMSSPLACFPLHAIPTIRHSIQR